MVILAALGWSLLPLCLCLDYRDLRVNSVTGNLRPPLHWSDLTFNLIKQFRLRNLAYSQALGVPRDPGLFPEERFSKPHRRQKRDVSVSRMGEQVSSMAMGVYRQEQMLISPVNSVESVSLTTAGDVTNTFILGYENSDGSVLELKVDVSSSGVFKIYHAAWSDEQKKIVADTELNSELNPVDKDGELMIYPLNVTLEDGARISDMELAMDPKSGQHYLAVMIDLALEWPAEADRSSTAYMDINVPIKMPEHGKSKIFEFNLANSTSYEYFELMSVPSIEAKDGSFFVVDQALHLVIAHRGNYTLDTKLSESIHLRLKEGQGRDTFVHVQGYQGIDKDGDQIVTDLSFSTQGPNKALHFQLHHRDFVVFANTNSRNYTTADEFSYIYKYKFGHHDGKYELVQKLPTFSPVDVTFAPIHDPHNPLNSQYFLVFANHEDAKGADVDSFVFKWIDGKFLPFQSLQLPSKPVSVSSFEMNVLEDGEDMNILQQFIVFVMENNKMIFFQFDGHVFQKAHPDADDSEVDVPEVIHDSVAQDVSSVEALKLGQDVILNLRYGNGMLHQAKVDFNTTEALNMFYESSGKFRNYVSHHRAVLPDTRAMYNDYLNSPRQTDDPIQVESVTFSGDFSVDSINVVPGMLPKPQDGNVPETSFTVHGKTVLDAHLIRQLEKYNTGIETNFNNSIAHMKLLIDAYETKVNASAKINQVNEIKDKVIFHDLTVTDRLKTGKIHVNIENEDDRDVFTSDGSTFYELENYMEEAIYLGGAEDVVYIKWPMTFENVHVARDYILHTLNGNSVTSYWYSSGDIATVPGTTTLGVGAKFDGASTVGGTVAGNKFTAENLLLKTGDQTLTGNWTFLGDLTLPNIVTAKINGFELSIIDRVVTYTTDHILLNQIDKLYVDNLLLPAITHDTIDILNTDYPHDKEKEVHLPDLMGKSFLKDGGGSVLLSYNFTNDVTIAEGTSATLNGVEFPQKFVPFHDTVQELRTDGTATVIFDNVIVPDGVTVNVASQLQCGDWSYSRESGELTKNPDDEVKVDSDGNLKLLLLRPTTLANYAHSVTGRKNFPTVSFMEDVTVVNLVLGYNLSQLEAEVEVDAGPTSFDGDYTITDLTLTSVIAIGKLVLPDSLFVNTMEVNMTDVFSYAVDRHMTSWPTTITNVTFFNMAEFEKDLNVASLNTYDNDFTSVNPENDFLRVSGPSVTFDHAVSFSEDVSFTKDLLQITENTIQTCDLGSKELCLCSDCSDSSCGLMEGECVVNDDSNVNTNLYSGIHSTVLQYFNQNALKLTGDQVIMSKIIFNEGFTVDNLTVATSDCEINTIACDDIALINIEQTFTGLNTFKGSIRFNANSTVTINEELTVAGDVGNYDLNLIYTDSLFQSLEDQEGQAITQNITSANPHYFNENIFIDNLVTNNVNLSVSGTNVDPRDLFSDDYVLDSSTDVIILGSLVFEENVDLASFEVSDLSVTWDGITLDNFFHNLLLNNGSDQTVTGDVTVDGSLTIVSGLSKDDTASVTKINQVDILDLANRALRISGDNVIANGATLGDVNLGVIEAVQGILLDGDFLGVNINEAVTRTSSSTQVISASHNFDGGLEISGDVAVTGVIESTDDSSHNFILDKLVQFAAGDSSVTKVRVSHSSGARAKTEPVMTTVNSVNLASLRSSQWHAKDNVNLSANMSLAKADFTGTLNVDTLNNISLKPWRDTYLSLSRHQTISALYTFSHLVLSGKVSVNQVFVGEEDGTEGILKTLATSSREATEHQFTDRYFKVMFRNMSYDNINTVLSPDAVDVAGDVLVNPGVQINGVDLGDGVLTYKTNDEKTFTSSLTVDGGLKIVKGTSGNGNLNLYSNFVKYNESSDETIISLKPSDRYSAAVKMSEDTSIPIEISGDVQISAHPTFTDLIVESGSSINSADIGSCSSPKILTTDNCHSSSDDQIIKTSLTFNSPEEERDLTVAAVLFSTTEPEVNEMIWEEELAKMISKTETKKVVITGAKTFHQEEFTIDSSIPFYIFNTLFGISLAAREKVLDLSYPSGNNEDIPDDDTGDMKPVMPDLELALENIIYNSQGMSDQFLYHTPLMTGTDNDMRIKNIDVFSGLLADNATTADWDALPFHMVTFAANVESREVSLSFGRLSQLDGDINITTLEPPPAALTSSLTYRDYRGPQSMGDMVALHHSNDWYYLLTTLTQDTSGIDSLVTGVDLNDGTVVLLLKWIDTSSDFQTVQNLKQNWNDLQPIMIANQSCVVGCGVDSQILCFTSGVSSSGDTSLQYLAPSQDLTGLGALGECFKASSVERENDGTKEDLLVIASNHNSEDGMVTIFTYEQLNSNFSHAQTIPCYYCSFADVGKFGEDIFIVIMSELSNFIYIGKYDQSQKKFVIFQNLNLALPQQAYFYNQDGNLLLSVLAKPNERNEIFTFIYQGSMAFVEESEKTINLLGVESHNILSHSLLGSLLVSSTGVPAPGRILSANTLLQETYKQTDSAAVREHLETSPAQLPLMLSPQCKDMALNYVEKLYNSTSSGTEKTEAFAKLALRLLPRPFLQFYTDSFTIPVQDIFENAERSLMISNQAEAYIIFYAYTNFDTDLGRDLDTTGFRGTGLVFQDKDGILFMRFRIKDEPFSGSNYRGFSILESCDANTLVTHSSFSSADYNPSETSVKDDVQEMCLMVHDFSREEMLKNITGVGNAGAVSIQDSTGSTFACGFMIHPQQAMVILAKEHEDLDPSLILQN